MLHSLSLCVRESSAISVITRLTEGLVKIRTSNPVQSLVEQFNATPIGVLSRVFEKEKLLPRPRKRPKCYHYSIQVTVYIGKIIQTRRSQYTHCNISQNCVSKCTGLHLGAYLFQKISRGYAPRPP